MNGFEQFTLSMFFFSILFFCIARKKYVGPSSGVNRYWNSFWPIFISLTMVFAVMGAFKGDSVKTILLAPIPAGLIAIFFGLGEVLKINLGSREGRGFIMALVAFLVCSSILVQSWLAL